MFIHGTYKIIACKAMEMKMAPRSHLLDHGGCFNKLEFSDKAFKALNISTVTRTVMDMVEGRRSLNI